MEHRPAGRGRTPDRTQRLLDRASWDTLAAMSAVRRLATAGLKRQCTSCAGRVANGINTVHLSGK